MKRGLARLASAVGMVLGTCGAPARPHVPADDAVVVERLPLHRLGI